MIHLLAQVVPPAPTPPASGWTFWQFLSILTPAILLLLGQLMTWLKTKQAAQDAADAKDSARSAESHSRVVAHHARHLDSINTKLDRIARVTPGAQAEEEMVIRPHETPHAPRPPRPEGG
jgi:hypothetical protein